MVFNVMAEPAGREGHSSGPFYVGDGTAAGCEQVACSAANLECTFPIAASIPGGF